MKERSLRGLMLLLAPLMLFIGCGEEETEVDVDQTGDSTAAAAEEAISGDEWVRLFNAGDWEGIRAFYTDDYVYHSTMGDMNLDQSLGFLRSFKEAFNITIEPLRGIQQGDMVAWHARMSGTHEGAFMGIEPTGKAVTIEGIGMQRIVDGKIAEEWDIIDEMGLMQQIGVVPAMEGDPAAAAPGPGDAATADTGTGDTTSM